MSYKSERWTETLKKRDERASEWRDASTRGKLLYSIRARRIALGLTLDEVASKVGTNTGSLSNIERNHVGASLDMLLAICQALGMQVQLVPLEELDDAK